jgi:hypothetical protein
MKALAAALGLTLLAAPAFAGEAGEEALYHRGECAGVGGIYEAAIEIGATDPRIVSATTAFHNFEPQMKAHTDALANALSDERSTAVRDRLLADYEGDLTLWAGSEDRDGFLLATWGKTMDRCLKEATALPVPGLPVT